MRIGSTAPAVPGARAGGARSGLADLAQALQRHPLWLFLAWQDIRQRYRRSVLGPFWLTISTGIQIGTLGLLWSALFHQRAEEFLPYFAVGLVLWQFLAGVLLESCQGFTQFEAIIRQTRLPFSAFLLRILCRHLIVLGHNLLVIVAVYAVLGRRLPWDALLFLPGLLLLILFAFFLAGPVAVLCTRFRDMPPIVSNLSNVLYYLTPIMWTPATLPQLPWVYQYNPLHHLLQTVRAPLLGALPSQADYGWSAVAVLGATSLYVLILGRYRNRIAYWL